MLNIFVPDFCDKEQLPPSGARVVLGMSGGVDSSSTAAILKAHGCDVLGVFIELLSSKSVEAAKADAAKMAKFVGIDFEVIDFKQEFENKVILPFVQEYCNGRTPLPCSLCNRFIKFAALCSVADRVNTEYVATGHYVQRSMRNGVQTLERAVNGQRDQSYFLYMVEPQQLARAYFPLGRAPTKKVVREFAGQIGLGVAEKTNAYDVCFLSDFEGDYIRFIMAYIKKHPELAESPALHSGNLIGVWGNNSKVGEHQGAVRYTIGQRRGIGVSAQNPLYVVGINGGDVYVGEKCALATKDIFLKDVRFHEIADFAIPDRAQFTDVLIQFRSTCPAIPGKFVYYSETGSAVAQFDHEQFGVALGQAAVIRDNNGTVLAGGVIEETDSIARLNYRKVG
jgi:tRNA-specific 2-thiouridylase